MATLHPIAVDLDNTLVNTDTLYESILLIAKEHPFKLPLLILWLFRGRSQLKQKVSELVSINPAHLPYNHPYYEFLRTQKDLGHKLYLVTAAHESIAKAVFDHLGIFDEYFASDEHRNLKGRVKAQLLVDKFGEKGFSYAGDSLSDLAVWERAKEAVVVNAAPGFEKKVAKVCPVARTFSKPFSPKVLLKAFRPHHWVKNLLIFVPPAMAHKINDPTVMVPAIFCFIAFCIGASSVYITNDLLDLESDRSHPEKRHRPFAAGKISILYGLAFAPVLLVGAFIMSAIISWEALAVFLSYFFLTLAYSTWLKQIPIADIVVLGNLYTWRVFAGGAATGVLLSPWLLAFSMFLFFALAVIKRCAELLQMQDLGVKSPKGRGYVADDYTTLVSLGTSSSLLSILVLALYINNEKVESLYANPKALWIMCPLLMYWAARLWLLTDRRQMHSDPITFVATDKNSWIVGAMVFACWIAAIRPWG